MCTNVTISAFQIKYCTFHLKVRQKRKKNGTKKRGLYEEFRKMACLPAINAPCHHVTPCSVKEGQLHLPETGSRLHPKLSFKKDMKGF